MGKLEMIEQEKKEKNLNFLHVPYFIASGSHVSKGDKYRFLIMPKYHKDLEAIFQIKINFNLKTVLVIASRIIDTLEYIHSHGYVHSDIKDSNIMLGQSQDIKKVLRKRCPVRKIPNRNCKCARESVYSNLDKFEGEELYPIDYGLAAKYLLSTGEHREFCSDQRRAHSGTILFCSRDAYKGIPSSKSDLESLTYNMIYWLTVPCLGLMMFMNQN